MEGLALRVRTSRNTVLGLTNDSADSVSLLGESKVNCSYSDVDSGREDGKVNGACSLGLAGRRRIRWVADGSGGSPMGQAGCQRVKDGKLTLGPLPVDFLGLGRRTGVTGTASRTTGVGGAARPGRPRQGRHALKEKDTETRTMT